MRNFCLGALCCALAAAVPAAVDLDPILITTGRLAAAEPSPARVTVVERPAIAASGAASLAELLRGRGGIQVRDAYGDGGSASIDLRGFGATAAANTLVLVDGRRLNPASDSATLYLGAVDLDDVERVEILQGSAGSRYGNQAVGGVVNIVTRRPVGAGAETRLGLGSYDQRRVSVRLADRSTGGWGAQLKARLANTDNYRRHNAVDRRTLNLLLDREHAAGRLFLELEDFAEDSLTPGGLFLDEAAADRRQSVATYAGDFIDTRSQRLRAGLEQRLAPAWDLAAELGWQSDDRDFVQSFRLFPGSPATQDRRTWTLTPRLDGTLGGTRVALGLDLEDTDYLLRTAFGPQAVEQANHALYGQATLPLAAGWTLDAGLRHARVRNRIDLGATSQLNDQVTVGSLGLVFAPDSRWQLRARADQNYRFAKVDEHTNVVFGQPLGLDNQRGVSYELGADYRHRVTRLQLALYQLELRDEISFDASGFVNVNLDRTRRRGLSLGGTRALGRTLLAGFDYDYVDSAITDGPNAGNRIPLVPEQRLRLFAQWAVDPRTSLDLEAILVSDQAYGGDFANRFPTLAGYGVVNLSAHHRRGPWRFGLRLNNLFDQRYSETGEIGLDASGSGHPLCITDAFSDSCPAINPAPERNLLLTLGYRYGS